MLWFLQLFFLHNFLISIINAAVGGNYTFLETGHGMDGPYEFYKCKEAELIFNNTKSL
jgi:hypothetical protein